MEDARRYDPAVHAHVVGATSRRGAHVSREVHELRADRRNAAATRTKSLVRAVGVFCRQNFTKAEILRERRRLEAEARRAAMPAAAATPPKPVATPPPGKRGPKIARDDF